VPLLNPLPTIRCGRGRDLPGTSLPRSRRSKLGYAPLPYCVVGPGRGQCSIHAATCHPQEQGGAWLHELKVARLHELPECELQLTSHVHAGDSASSHVPVHDPMLLEAELGRRSTRPSPHLGQQSLLDPVLESVGFEVGLEPAHPVELASNQGQPADSNAAAVLVPPSLLDFVNTSRGVELVQMLEGVIPSSPSSFVRVLSKPVASNVLPTSSKTQAPCAGPSNLATNAAPDSRRRHPTVHWPLLPLKIYS
jgi:hypothetical protein